MPIDANTLKRWASGKSSAQATKDSEDAFEPESDDGSYDEDMDSEGDEDVEASGDSDSLWDGTESGDLEEVVTPERAAELLSWLEENESEIHETVLELAKAVVESNDEMIQHGTEELAWVKQHTGDDFSESQRQSMADRIKSGLESAGDPEVDSPEYQVAVAKAIAEARSGGDDSELDESDEDTDEFDPDQDEPEPDSMEDL
jgi:hypothetical protein